VLRLADAVPVSKGARRLVYPDPTDAGAVLKATSPAWRRKRARKRGLKRLKWLKRQFTRSNGDREIDAEARESKRIAARAAARGLDSPLPRFLGFAPTDLGRATRQERLSGPGGGPAPSLRDAWADGADPSLVDAVGRLLWVLQELSVVLVDLHPGNVVVAEEDGRPVCRLMDGFGDRATVPLRRCCRRSTGGATTAGSPVSRDASAWSGMRARECCDLATKAASRCERASGRRPRVESGTSGRDRPSPYRADTGDRHGPGMSPPDG
jgi:hypothetical protein